MITLHNLAPDATSVELDLGDAAAGSLLVEQLRHGEHEVAPDGRVEIPLEGYGYRWLRLLDQSDRRRG